MPNCSSSGGGGGGGGGAFASRKKKIQDSLAAPQELYEDSSPKGSVDDGIKELIDAINRTDGLVTTSSCAGRVSVFLEGKKKAATSPDREVDEAGSGGGGGAAAAAQKGAKAVLGGKGLGGRWLFVSHEPVVRGLDEPGGHGSVPSRGEALFNMAPSTGDGGVPGDVAIEAVRFVRFQFEPMILHVMAASLEHARPLLAAALDAGFRESGIQSLRCLEDPAAFPMVAIRSSGLALSSVIGYLLDDDDDDDDCSGENQDRRWERQRPKSLVSDEHLRMLLRMANARFGANSQRIERLRRNILRFSDPAVAIAVDVAGPEARKMRASRKRADGLKRQMEETRSKVMVGRESAQKEGSDEVDPADDPIENGLGLFNF